MVRWTRDDKKTIALAQKQIVYKEDWIGNETNSVDGYRCKKCHRVLDLDILEVDHIIPRAKRGSDRPSNLQLLCPPCNKKKSDNITAKAKMLIKKGAVRTTVKRTAKAATKTKPAVKKATVKKVVKTKPTKAVSKPKKTTAKRTVKRTKK
jgi:5-methylcytosine-specific restriction endonuclease McrA